MLTPNRSKVYLQSKELIETVYTISNKFPDDEKYGITSQIKRAVVSIATNIAEGCGRNSKAELLRFFSISLGSLLEVRSLLEISLNLNYLTEDEFNKIYPFSISLSKQIASFMKNLKNPQSSRVPV